MPRGQALGLKKELKQLVKAPAATSQKASLPLSLDFWAPGPGPKGGSSEGLRSGNQRSLRRGHQGRGATGACVRCLGCLPSGRRLLVVRQPGRNRRARACVGREVFRGGGYICTLRGMSFGKRLRGDGDFHNFQVGVSF